MSFYQDKQIKIYGYFLAAFGFLMVGAWLLFYLYQTNSVKTTCLLHDEAVVSSLLEQGVSRDIIAAAITNTHISIAGEELSAAVGIKSLKNRSGLPDITQIQHTSICSMIAISILLAVVLFIGTWWFFWQRKRLYEQAETIIQNYINGDYSCHLPQNSEGAVFQLFGQIEQLATMLQAKNEAERKAKEFLKSTISDISHQLKTPLAALTMYQEIIAGEPDHPETVKEFSGKLGIALKRMEQLIQSMLKIARLDSGNILFEKSNFRMSELISRSINELTTRAEKENKKIQIEGNAEQQLVCDLEWTSEAIGNIVKNALDHVRPGGIIQITWERTPAIFRIFISDNGNGVAPEDIHHIFKRFYRSRHSLDTQGVGLGLPLAKSIIEGQGGCIAVQSEGNKGTTFTISFLTEL
ncbi:sensor histidine kinase [Acutalibacter intestini]|uniref:sensor histidine kinase n=1 Tax=Acutalibacter intestini TaxID=3093659 RepID=UPI002AC94D29|nr:HAMP domain-containing sensor histidine kinase [Acutalibacter sp. M00204]